MSLIVFIVFAAFVTGAVLLQIYLSKKDNKWLGLILPAVFFIISFVGIYNTSHMSGEASTEMLIIAIVMGYSLFNIPTGILLLIYTKYRDKRR